MRLRVDGEVIVVAEVGLTMLANGAEIVSW